MESSKNTIDVEMKSSKGISGEGVVIVSAELK